MITNHNSTKKNKSGKRIKVTFEVSQHTGLCLSVFLKGASLSHNNPMFGKRMRNQFGKIATNIKGQIDKSFDK